MTDFRQRQAISTLTAPAARGLSPHYLVQPVSLHNPPGHGNKYEIIYRLHYNTKAPKVNSGYGRKSQLRAFVFGGFLQKNKHAKKKQLFRHPCKFQAAFLCQLGHIDAVSGHTTDLFFRVDSKKLFPPVLFLKNSRMGQKHFEDTQEQPNVGDGIRLHFRL